MDYKVRHKDAHKEERKDVHKKKYQNIKREHWRNKEERNNEIERKLEECKPTSLR